MRYVPEMEFGKAMGGDTHLGVDATLDGLPILGGGLGGHSDRPVAAVGLHHVLSAPGPLVARKKQVSHICCDTKGGEDENFCCPSGGGTYPVGGGGKARLDAAEILPAQENKEPHRNVKYVND